MSQIPSSGADKDKNTVWYIIGPDHIQENIKDINIGGNIIKKKM